MKINRETIKLKKILKDGNERGLALDIDETLSWTVGHWMEKMQELFGNPEGLTAKELAAKYRYTQNVPYWQGQEAIDFNKKLIDGSEYYKDCAVIEGAQEAVRKINKIIPIKAYITTRPENVHDCSVEWLQRNGFPEAPVIARPLNIPISEANKWKAINLEYLYPQILGMVDDSLKLIDSLTLGYQGKVFLLDSQTVSNKEFVFDCPRWEDVYLKVLENF